MVALGAGPTRVIEFRVLGSLEVVDQDGRLLALGAPQQRALLAVLVLHRGEAVSSDRLIDEIWGEQPPASANKLVQGYVSSLRKVLGEGLLVTRGHGYLLQAEPGQVDIDRFESLLAEGRAARGDGDPRRAAERSAGGAGALAGLAACGLRLRAVRPTRDRTAGGAAPGRAGGADRRGPGLGRARAAGGRARGIGP